MISVIVPVYNVEAYLRKCLDSVVNQTYENLEILIVDDGSTDQSGKICDEYQSDRRVKVYHTDNHGLSAARNHALDRATGDYIAFLDSDDWFEPDLLKHLVSASAAGTKKLVEASFTWEFSDHQSFYQAPRCCSNSCFLLMWMNYLNYLVMEESSFI